MASIQPYAPVLDRQKAAHLLRRVTFGPTKDLIDLYTGQTVTNALQTLIPTDTSTLPDDPIDPKTGITWLPKGVEDVNSGDNTLIDVVKGWWLDRMFTSNDLWERMVFFYHTHFTTIASVVNSSSALYYQNQLIRYYALGNYKQLALKMCIDNSMLIFLDGRDNIVGRPQENFAREFLELFTIGKGPQIGPDDYTNYTEQDVQAAAKVLSGYTNDKDFLTIDPDTNLPTGMLKGDGLIATQHDASPKQFSDKFQNTIIQPATVIDERTTKIEALQEISDMVDMIFAQPETAKFLCRKLYRHFCYYEITDEIEQDIIVPLANTLTTNDFEILPVIQQLLSCQHFFDADNTEDKDDVNGSIIKSPLEITLGTMRHFQVQIPTDPSEKFFNIYQKVLGKLEDQGMAFLEPYDVAGYDAYHQFPDYSRNWISANYLGNRYLFISDLIDGIGDEEDYTEKIYLDVMDFVNKRVTNPSNATEIVQTFVDYLLPEIITQERFDYFLKDILLDDLSLINWSNEWQDYQDTGVDMGVRTQLNNLCIGMMQSPEYQLY